jgi:chemotaxis methyl-accepting protein methylase
MRNIFYYLNAQGREEVLDNLEPYLEKGGYLVLGRMDTAPLNKRSYKPEGENIFRKV